MTDNIRARFDVWWERFYDEHKETPTTFESWLAAHAEAEKRIKEILSKRSVRVNEDGTMDMVSCESCEEAKALVAELVEAVELSQNLGVGITALGNQHIIDEALTKAQQFLGDTK